jgi:ferric-dicitrate binding protein FerR (iron transport regulator)
MRINDELIVRYLAGEATPEEAMALHDWLASPENRLYFEELQRTWSVTFPSRSQRTIHRGDAWKAVDQRMNTISPTPTKTVGLFNPSGFALRVAASFVIILAASLIIYLKIRHVTYPEVNIATTGEAQHVTLPDNSTVTLYRNTAISYTEHFEGDQRALTLSRGEAFFNVMHDQKKPFLISTTLATIRVVGTSFNVKMNDDVLEVGVHEGRVLVYTPNDSIYLNAGFTGIVQLATKAMNVKDSVNTNAWGYATGKLSYTETPLPEVISDIERTYHCTIDLGNSDIGKCRLTAIFDNVSAENIINLIAETLNLTVSKNGTVYTLEGEGCP